MKKINFNHNWTVCRLDGEGREQGERTWVSLPHDAMLGEGRSREHAGAHNIGYFDGGIYEYRKRFWVSEEDRDSAMVMELEGAYHKAQVYINGRHVLSRPYGYTDFRVDMDGLLRYGWENEIVVRVDNADQPNSRWYSGSGLYRPVWLYRGGRAYIPPRGIRVRTLSLDPAVLEISVKTVRRSGEPVGKTVREASGAEDVFLKIRDPEENVIFSGWTASSCEGVAGLTVTLREAMPWSTDHPRLYRLEAEFDGDKAEQEFGIRLLEWSKEKGLSVNGERVILKGACIHHDNGILGACTYPEAEHRRVRLLKEAGYNALRMAHNPCSVYLLEACDRLGMLVMDEYTDMWYIHKTPYDYASQCGEWWREDLKNMVEKDYNHPCVILYSTGNEVAETSQKRGVRLAKEMTDYLHSLDESRPVTCGVNIFFNMLFRMGLGVYSDEKAKREAEKHKESGLQKAGQKRAAVGSEFYNVLAGLLGDRFMKLGATLYPCDVLTRAAFASMDIAGYNYGIDRYRHDLKKYPDRMILGSETFCSDAYRFYEMAQKQPRLVGDFVWAGMDYIGEAGIGSWEYEDYAPKQADRAAWLTAGSGRLDITGRGGGEALYTRVALGESMGPFLAVRPVYQRGRHSPSAWKMTDARPSWSWRGCEGMKARVEVYARADRVELWLNGRYVGRPGRHP